MGRSTAPAAAAAVWRVQSAGERAEREEREREALKKKTRTQSPMPMMARLEKSQPRPRRLDVSTFVGLLVTCPNLQTASIAQAAIGAALGAGGLNSMDAANLMAGFATAALNNSGGGDRGGGQGGFFEKGASWATSRLSALVGGSAPHQQQHTGEGNPDGAFDGGAAHQQNYSPRGGGLFSFLSPVGGAAALSVSPSYCRAKLLLLSAPWLRRWPYARVREHQSVASTGGPTRYAPPSRDVHAPDLYIPAMALATLALLRGAAAVFSTRSSSPLSAFSRRDQSGHSFSPETISNAVSSLATAWLLSGAALKAALLALGSGAAAAVPLAELAAYAGYPLFHGAAVCAVRGAGSLASSSSSSSAFSAPHASPSSLSSSAATANNILNKLGSGSASGATGAARWAGDAAVLWGGAAAGVFLVRSLKRVLFQDARGRDEGRRAAAPAYGGGNGFGGGDPNFGYGGGIPSQSQSSSPSSAATTSRSNYVLLLLWFAQFPLVAWLARGCRVAS